MIKALLLFFLINTTNVEAFFSYNPLGSILSENGIPRWTEILNNNYVDNIYKIKIENHILATGFIVNKNSNYIITNAHVALFARGTNQVEKLSAVNNSNTIKVTEIIVVDKDLDFALLKFEWIEKKKEIKDIQIYDGYLPQIDNPLYIIGYAQTAANFVKSHGKIIEMDYSKSKKPCFKYNADTDPGMSGSPVFNSQNELIGLHYGSPERGKNNAIPFQLIMDRYSDIIN